MCRPNVGVRIIRSGIGEWLGSLNPTGATTNSSCSLARITTPGAITSPQRVLAGEALLLPAETAAPQAVVARDRLTQRVRCVTHRAPSGSSSALSDLVSGEQFAASEPGNSSFTDERRERQILRKGAGAEG